MSGVYYFGHSRPLARNNIDLPQAQNFHDFVDTVSTSSEDKVEQPKTEKATGTTVAAVPSKKIAEDINLAVPFTSQAPTQNWNQPFQDACEEASLLMVDYYYQNKNLPDKVAVENILQDMVTWQEQHWGAHENLTVAKLADFALTNFNYHSEIVHDLTVDKIKSYLLKGRPLIVPADGKKLANPNFRNGGPVYHMLVIKGFVGDKFITNDPGTRNGADFVYAQDNLIESIADWDANKNAASGGKVALVIMPK